MLHVVLCLAVEEDGLLMFLPLDFLWAKDRAGIDVVEVSGKVGAGALILISNRVLLAIIVLQHPVVLARRLDLRLLFNSQIVLIVELHRQEA